MNLRKKVGEFLFDFDFPTRVNGYQYLKEGMINILESDIMPSNKILFCDLAKRFNTDVDNIDRCLRTLVDKMWATFAKMGWFTERPTNREFIIKCAEFVSSRNSQASVYDILSRPD